ncbi:hypothetical protein EXN66_Car012301 [Channa argus]|uniref:Uncharacterized protein n=1 Tax=Channa argus TaxID=215402 RepID=A0A6G1Q2N2_CHAAH|nr:hypothetical protein EXN66_Car012301 [Channa argus]
MAAERNVYRLQSGFLLHVDSGSPGIRSRGFQTCVNKQFVPVRSASVNVSHSRDAKMAWDKHCGAKLVLLPIHMKTPLINDPHQFSLTCQAAESLLGHNIYFSNEELSY